MAIDMAIDLLYQIGQSIIYENFAYNLKRRHEIVTVYN